MKLKNLLLLCLVLGLQAGQHVRAQELIVRSGEELLSAIGSFINSGGNLTIRLSGTNISLADGLTFPANAGLVPPTPSALVLEGGQPGGLNALVDFGMRSNLTGAFENGRTLTWKVRS